MVVITATPPQSLLRDENFYEQFFITLQTVFNPLQQHLQSLLEWNINAASSRIHVAGWTGNPINQKEWIIIGYDDQGNGSFTEANRCTLRSELTQENESLAKETSVNGSTIHASVFNWRTTEISSGRVVH